MDRTMKFEVIKEVERSGYRITMLCKWSDGDYSEEFSYSRDYSSKPVSEIANEIQQAYSGAEALAQDKHTRYMAAQNA